jgi:hypothetical protein
MDTSSEQSRTNYSQIITSICLLIGVISIGITSIIGINDNIPGIILLLVGSFLIVYAILHRFGASKNLRPGLQLLYWSPRVLAIVFIAFTCIFAADVFNESHGLWQTILALFMHLIPQMLLIAFLILSWRREWIIGTVCILLSIVYVVSMWGRFPIDVYLLIAGHLVIIGGLFLLNWHYRDIFRPSIPN